MLESTLKYKNSVRIIMAVAKSSFISDFRDFIVKGNVVDLAVAVVLGGAFGKIVESFVKDVITPAILAPALKAASVSDIEKLVVGDNVKIGLFLAAVINFLVISFVIFLVVRAYEKAKKKFARQEAMAEPAPDAAVVAQQQLVTALDRLNSTVAQKM
jgi:large conductance mechanosensitive channel